MVGKKSVSTTDNKVIMALALPEKDKRKHADRLVNHALLYRGRP